MAGRSPTRSSRPASVRSRSPFATATGAVRAAMNVTVHAAETSSTRCSTSHLPHLLRAAGEVSADWALWQSRPHVEVGPAPQT